MSSVKVISKLPGSVWKRARPPAAATVASSSIDPLPHWGRNVADGEWHRVPGLTLALFILVTSHLGSTGDASLLTCRSLGITSVANSVMLRRVSSEGTLPTEKFATKTPKPTRRA